MRANDNMSDKSDKQKDGRAIKIGKKKIRIKKAVKKTTAGAKNTSDKKNTPQGTNKTKRSKKQIWMSVALIVCGFFVAVGLVGVGVMFTWMSSAPPLDMSKFDYTATTVIYDINGDPYQELQTAESRTPVTIDEVGKLTQLAFVSIEDQRFYSHKGVDIRGTLKAIINVLLSGETDGPGGSSLTQQLIKNTHLTSETSIERKVKEWKLSFQLEGNMEKDKILESYLNQVNMSITWGIQSAAEDYFGKDADELTIAQSAVLASIIKAPTFYNPYKYDVAEDGKRYIVKTKDENGKTIIGYDPDNMERAILIVDKMYELGHINEREHEIAVNQLENNLIGLTLSGDSSTYTYFTDAVYLEVRDEIMEQYNYTQDDAENLLLNGGLKIYSTVDPVIQDALEEQAADNDNFPSQSSSARNASEAMSEATGEDVNFIPQLGGVVLENETGYVVGIIGGRNKDASLTLNRALRKFQIGSTTKPLTVYGAGIDSEKITMASTFDNVPLNFPGWKIVNTPATYTGMTSSRQGIVGSINVVAVLAQKKVGIDTSAMYAELFGFEITREGKKNDMNSAAFALGGYTYGQTPLAVANAYTTFPNGGYRITPTFYTTVEDSNGNVILTTTQESVQVLREETAFIVTSALRQVVRGGTTTRSVPGQQMGGKTGTTDDEACTWFTGFTPKYTASFWWGYDENIVTVDGKTYYLNINMGGGGRNSPAQYWEKVFRQFYDEKDLPDADLPGRPDGVISAGIDSVSGKAPTELTDLDPRGPQRRSEYFIKGTYPAESDDMHVEVNICADTGLLATEYCTHVETVVMIDKTVAQAAWPEGASLRIADYVASNEKDAIAPTEYCTIHTEENAVTGFEFSTEFATNNIVSEVTINEGESTMLYLKTVSANGTANITSETPTYIAGNEAVATVTTSGKGISINAISAGTTTITASYTYGTEHTVSRTIQINVEPIVVDPPEPDPSEPEPPVDPPEPDPPADPAPPEDSGMIDRNLTFNTAFKLVGSIF